MVFRGERTRIDDQGRRAVQKLTGEQYTVACVGIGGERGWCSHEAWSEQRYGGRHGVAMVQGVAQEHLAGRGSSRSQVIHDAVLDHRLRRIAKLNDGVRGQPGAIRQIQDIVANSDIFREA